MLHEVEAFLQEGLGLPPQASILVAVSGGVDSVVLSVLLAQLPYKVALAHVNFQLRGADSDADADFVAALARKLKLPFFVTRFETLDYANRKGQSVQEAARDLRYEWLEHIRSQNGYSYIATAHHQNDSIETAIFHFARGTGIHGLTGIPLKNGLIIRPLIRRFRSEILAYAEKEQLKWREDASNAGTKYQRNFIRHQVVPTLEALHGGFEKGAATTLAHLRAAAQWYDWAILHWKEKVMEAEGELRRIDLEHLSQAPDPPTLLWEMLRLWGFSSGQVSDMLHPHTHTGAAFSSATHRVVKDRMQLLLYPETSKEGLNLSINIADREVLLPSGKLLLSPSHAPPATFSVDLNMAWLSLTTEDFPLTLRYWQPGDQFQPFGMKGKRQKLQDFLTNRKLSLPEKEKVMVLLTVKNNICWVPGHRIDHRFRIRPACKEAWRLELKIS